MAQEPIIVPLTIRRLKPGTYAEWRKAWHDPTNPDALWVEQESKAYILRNLDDPDEIVALGFIHGQLDDLRSLRSDPEVERRQRLRPLDVDVGELLKLGPGTVLELDRRVGEAIDIYVNNRLVARGEVVLVEDKLGVTMTEIIKAERA